MARAQRPVGGRTSTRPRSWQEMFVQVQAQLQRQTGEDLATWNARIRAESGLTDEPSLRPGSPDAA